MNKLNLYLFLSACMTMPSILSAQSVKYDFEEGIPTGTELYNMDHNTPAPDTSAMGFDENSSWISYILPSENNGVACSTSWYSPAGTSEDWMVLPPYEEASERCVLAWRAKASDPQLRDGYKVCVSTTGNQLKDFDLSKPVFETAAETSEWNAHEVSLSQFAGQKVWVAFVNTSTDCTFLYVDDVFIGERRIITMRPAMNTLCLPEQTIALSVAVGTELNQSVKGVTLQVEADGKTYIKECPDLVINPGEETVIDMGASVRPPKDIPVHCVLTATYGNHATSSEFDLAAFPAVRVVEEFTGTWCEFCVRGITAFDEMKKAHPDEFIGIAIHCGGINRDPMDSSNCAQGIQAWNFGGYPYAIMNRSKDLNGDPKDEVI